MTSRAFTEGCFMGVIFDMTAFAVARQFCIEPIHMTRFTSETVVRLAEGKSCLRQVIKGQRPGFLPVATGTVRAPRAQMNVVGAVTPHTAGRRFGKAHVREMAGGARQLSVGILQPKTGISFVVEHRFLPAAFIMALRAFTASSAAMHIVMAMAVHAHLRCPCINLINVAHAARLFSVRAEQSKVAHLIVIERVNLPAIL